MRHQHSQQNLLCKIVHMLLRHSLLWLGQLQPYDLVFFNTHAPGASHVGIYIGNGLMLDSQDMGAAIDGIENSCWGPKYIGASRYIK